MKTLLISLVFLLSLFISTNGLAQEGSAELFSLSKESGHVYIVNRTNQEVIFYLESENTDRTEHRLGPGMGSTFTGDSNDQWFNIQVYSGADANKHESSYGLDAGTRHYISWQNGILDVFALPPK